MNEALNEPLNEAEAVIHGQTQAEGFMRGLNRSVPRGDELFNALMAISESGDNLQLQGFARTLQKALEGIK